MNQERNKGLLQVIRPYRFRIIWTSLFFIAAILFLTLGFWKTILLILFISAGYLIGKIQDEELDLYSLLDLLRSMLGIG